MTYDELWNILWNWKKEFSVREFASVFPSPDHNKVLYDMAKKGLLEKVGWGKYKVNSPEEYLAKRINIPEAYDLLKQTGMKYALTGPDAVFLWTKGGYQVDRFFGFYPIHLKVRKDDVRKWEGFLKSRKQNFYTKDQPIKKTLFGVVYVLYQEADFRAEDVEEFKVEPLKTTVEFCRRRVYSYEPALEMLDEMYDLGLKVKYKEAETNF